MSYEVFAYVSTVSSTGKILEANLIPQAAHGAVSHSDAKRRPMVFLRRAKRGASQRPVLPDCGHPAGLPPQLR